MSHAEGRKGCLFPQSSDKYLARVRILQLYLLGVQNHESPLQAKAEAQRRHGGPAYFLYQAIVAAAAADSKRGAGGPADKLEHGAGVIIQPAHDGGIYCKGNADFLQRALNAFKMGGAILTQIIQHVGRPFCNPGAYRAFAVQNTHGVPIQPGKAGVTELIFVSGKIFFQSGGITGSASGAAYGIDLQAKIPDSQPLKDRCCQSDHLCVRQRRGAAEHLHTKLMELPQAALLSLFVAIAGSEIVKLQRETIVIQAMLQHSANSTRCALRPQGDGTIPLIFKGIHFLLHHVCGFPYAAQKELCMLKHRGAYFPEALQVGFLTHNLFQLLPFDCFCRQDVLCAPGGLCEQCHL